MTERHAERRLVKHRLVGSCGSVAGSRPRFSPAVSFELGGRGGFIAAVRRLPQLDLQLATPPYSNDYHGERSHLRCVVEQVGMYDGCQKQLLDLNRRHHLGLAHTMTTYNV
ncbi:hypothetical protein T4A_11112 [Trichinella pseudospiralis]|uniref:Uncharacterized protein n=1 Tax=Trichinella pseudospiralis TaxID=6337 RepID=A0A0V1E229_TRIPS|nr:hypothetical protein T4A_11112 [Trichinella pseudospiralis]